VKPQYVDQIPKAVKGPDRTVEQLLGARSQMDNLENICNVLGENNFCLTAIIIRDKLT
jgi:ATP-binding cassette subfamily E protein 1